MGAQTLGRDALRVLERLRLIVRPSDAGRERGDNASRDFHAPLGADDGKRLRELISLAVPHTRSLQIGHGSAGKERDERLGGTGADGLVTVGGGAVHARMIPCRPAHVNPQHRNKCKK